MIQMVVTSEDNSLFLKEFNVETNELIFRSSRNPQNLQKETVVIDNNTVYTNLYHFHVFFLNRVINK